MASVACHFRRTRLAIAGAVVLTVLTAATASASMPSAEGVTARGPASAAPSSATASPDGGHPSTRPGPGAKSQVPGFLLIRGRYLTFDVPGATVGASPSGVNDRLQITGKYNDGTARTGDGASEHGFVLDLRGRFTKIDVPGAKSTAASRINDLGQVAGVYSQTTGRVGDDPKRRGFLLDRGRLVRIDAPNAVYTQALALNNAGTVVGEFQDATGYHGFRWDKGRFTTIDVPGAISTTVLGINDKNELVGGYLTDPTLKPGTIHGFLLRKGKFTTIDAPGVAATFAGDINDAGQIVVGGIGNVDPTGRASGLSGFVLRNGVTGAFTPVAVPGALSTSPGGINDLGAVVGSYTPASAGSTTPQAAAMQPLG